MTIHVKKKYMHVSFLSHFTWCIKIPITPIKSTIQSFFLASTICIHKLLGGGGGGIHAEFWPSVIYIKILEFRLDICKKQFIFYILVSQQDFPLKSFAKIP